MAESIKVARADQLPGGARKLCSIEDRRIAIFNLSGTLYALTIITRTATDRWARAR